MDDSIEFAQLPQLATASGLARDWGVAPSLVSRLILEGRLLPVAVIPARRGKSHEHGGMLLFAMDTPKPESLPRGRPSLGWEQHVRERDFKTRENQRHRLISRIQELLAEAVSIDPDKNQAKFDALHDEVNELKDRYESKFGPYVDRGTKPMMPASDIELPSDHREKLIQKAKAYARLYALGEMSKAEYFRFLNESGLGVPDELLDPL